MSQALVERYADPLHGVLSCYDRIVVTGTLPQACYAQGMTSFLYAKGVRIFDYPQFAAPLRDAIRERAQDLAAAAGIEIEHISKGHIRKEDVVAKVLERRGDHEGLVHIISAMEACQSYKPWHDKASGKTYLKPDAGKCLHYYFYFIDSIVGLCYLRVPTWCPFKLQYYCNGHGWLGRKLKAKRIDSSSPTTPSSASMTSSARSSSPTVSSPTFWTVTRASAVRCKRLSDSAITGV